MVKDSGIRLHLHHVPRGISERFAFGLVKTLRFFAGRYSHRAVILETDAAQPARRSG